MVDERSVEAQRHEIQKIAHEIITEGKPLDEQFQIAVIIDKLPPGWKDFSIASFITRLWIEEETRRQDQKEEVFVVSNKKKTWCGSEAYGKTIKELEL